MNNKLIVVCKNQSFGESLAFSLNTIFGFEEHILHRTTRRLFAELKEIGIKDSVVLLQDGMIGVNYPALIDDIGKSQPALLILVGDSLSDTIPSSTLRELGCNAILGDEVGLKGIINSMTSWFADEYPIRTDIEPLSRLEEDNFSFLKDVFYLTSGEVQTKWKVSQQRVGSRRATLWKKLHLNPKYPMAAFRALCHLYKL